MDVEQIRKSLRALPYAVETMQWGANLVYWVGDKAIGGKMFALINLDEPRDPHKPHLLLSFYAGPERYPELLEHGAFVPAPYMARIFWVALPQQNSISRSELESLLKHAHRGVLDRLPARVREVLALPKRAQENLLAERKAVLEARASAEQQAASVPARKAAAAKKQTAKG